MVALIDEMAWPPMFVDVERRTKTKLENIFRSLEWKSALRI